jgi:membrane fusion protein (multidrug efflux system)
LLPPDNATGNFTKVVQRIPVRIALDGNSPSPLELRPGMSVIPSIETRSSSPARLAAAKTPTTISGVCHVPSEPVRIELRAADLAHHI